MGVDLHTHSTFSDGSDTPRALMAKAARLGLTAVAMTDHDTLEGLGEAEETARELGVELVPGTEISCDWPAGTMHMVVLFLEDRVGPLQDRLAELRQGREDRNEKIVRKLNDLGIDITLEEVLEEAGAGSVGRPHFAAILVRKRVVPDIKTAFEEYLAAGRAAYEGRVRLQPHEAVRIALASGGVPILAHPHTLGHDTAAEFTETLSMLADLGLVGIECLYGEYDRDRQREFSRMAERFGLLASGGSDYHGTYKPDVELGNVHVSEGVLADLRAARDLL